MRRWWLRRSLRVRLATWYAGTGAAVWVALEMARDEMQAYADERSDAWQQSERAAALADQIEALSTVLDDLQTLSAG